MKTITSVFSVVKNSLTYQKTQGERKFNEKDIKITDVYGGGNAVAYVNRLRRRQEGK